MSLRLDPQTQPAHRLRVGATRTLGMTLALALACVSLLSTACAGGYYLRRDSTFESKVSGFAIGNGSISSTRWAGPYGPVSGVSIEPGRTTVYDGVGAYGATGYGYVPPGYSPGGYAPYGGSTLSCSGAVECGIGGSTTIETWGLDASVPSGSATITVTPGR